MKATQLPSGSWRCQVYMGKDENGKRIYRSVTSKNKYECMEEANRLARHHHEITTNPGNMTLEEAIDDYINTKSNILSPATIRGYDTIKRNHLQPEMKMQVRKITNKVAQQAINREAGECSPKTVANIWGLMKTVIREYAGNDLHVSLPQKEDHDVYIMTEAECRQLIAALEGDGAEVPILMALFLGLRRSEIYALEHSDWDSERRILNVTKASVPDKDHQYVTKTTKTRKSRRQIAVPEYLAVKLDQCVEEGIPFCRYRIDVVAKHLSKICAREGLPHMGLHALRHQNASIMLKLGTPDKYAMERGGWSSNDTMKKIYQHTMDEKKREVDRTLNAYFDELATRPATQGEKL